MPLHTTPAQLRVKENRAVAEVHCHSSHTRATRPRALWPAEYSAQISQCREASSLLQALPHPRLPKLLRALRALLQRDRARLPTEPRSIPPCPQRRVPIAHPLLSVRENSDCFPRIPGSPESSPTPI